MKPNTHKADGAGSRNMTYVHHLVARGKVAAFEETLWHRSHSAYYYLRQIILELVRKFKSQQI
jgi:hypothetical protein